MLDVVPENEVICPTCSGAPQGGLCRTCGGRGTVGIDQPAAPQDVADTVASKARGYSIEGVELRGYEVAKYVISDDKHTGQQVGRWEQLERFAGNKYGYKKAVESAKWYFSREQDKPSEKQVPIRLRPIISVDPSTLQTMKEEDV